jgi:hypothetical protein
VESVESQSNGYLLHTGFLLASFLILEMERYVPPKCRLTFNGLQGVISQKVELSSITMFCIF